MLLKRIKSIKRKGKFNSFSSVFEKSIYYDILGNYIATEDLASSSEIIFTPHRNEHLSYHILYSQ